MAGLMVTFDTGFWAGRRVLLTGHTGFKGAWMTLLLNRLGATVTGLSLAAPVSEPCLFAAAGLHEMCDHQSGDVRDLGAVEAALAQSGAEILIHMAAQAIVRTGFQHPVETFETNVMGVVNVLEAARASPSLRAVVIVTSDKCYENFERVWPYREDEAMGGADPYSASKGAAELVTAAFAKTYFQDSEKPSVVSVRAGNVIGGGDWASDRLIPDLVRAAVAGSALAIRNPSSVRPWQHVLDPLAGYLMAAERAAKFAFHPHDAWNFGPNPGEELTVREVVDVFRQRWGGELAVVLADEHPDAARSKREAGLLRVDTTKAKVELGWFPALTNVAAIRAAAAWYVDFASDPGAARALTLAQIESLLGV